MVHFHVLNDFAKAERPWVKTMCDAMADNAAFSTPRSGASFANKVHLAMQSKGFGGADEKP
jgi:PTH1 family peptidyl-tRNA hydrolase